MRHWSVTPSPTGMQITGTDLGPADLFMLRDWIDQMVGVVAERTEDGAIRELVDRKDPGWSYTAAAAAKGNLE